MTTVTTFTAIAEDSGARLITQAQLLSNATNVSGPPLTATGLAITTGLGTLIDNNDGTWSYTPAHNDDTSVSFSWQVTDGSASVANSGTLDITPVNDAPVNTMPASPNVLAGTDVAISGLAVSDVDATSLTTTLHVDHGTLNVGAVGGATVTGSGSSTVTLSGSVAQIDAALGAFNNVLYHSASDFSLDHLTMTSSDGSLSDTDVLDLPISVPHAQFKFLDVGLPGSTQPVVVPDDFELASFVIPHIGFDYNSLFGVVHHDNDFDFFTPDYSVYVGGAARAPVAPAPHFLFGFDFGEVLNGLYVSIGDDGVVQFGDSALAHLIDSAQQTIGYVPLGAPNNSGSGSDFNFAAPLPVAQDFHLI